MTIFQEVDVVILSLNRSEMTVACVKSILVQQNITPHIWVIDQGSEETQLQTLIQYLQDKPWVKLIELKKNIGVPGGRNLGMKEGRSEYIFCIDNDAEFDSPYEISKAIDQFQKEEKVAVLGFKIVNYFTNELDLTSWSYPKTMLPWQDEIFITTRFCGAGHAIRRSALKLSNYYDENLFFYWEEVDLSYQVVNLGYKILYFPRVVVRHKVSRENKVSWGENRYYFLVRNFLYLNWKYYRSWWSFLIYATGYLVKGILNGLLCQSIHGIDDAIKMVHQLKNLDLLKLNKVGRHYIQMYDTKLRGNLFSRIKNELLARLPGEK